MTWTELQKRLTLPVLYPLVQALPEASYIEIRVTVGNTTVSMNYSGNTLHNLQLQCCPGKDVARG